MEKEVKVYLPMSADLIHNGHINIIKKASEFGQVTVGLLTDKAVARYKRVPFLTFKQRKFIAENIVGVHKVIQQEDDDYTTASENDHEDSPSTRKKQNDSNDTRNKKLHRKQEQSHSQRFLFSNI